MSNKIALFKGKKIRRIVYQNEWWFSVIDVVQALTDQIDNYTARKYWNKLAQRLREEGSEVVTFCHRLKLEAPDRKIRVTDCATTEIHRVENSRGMPKLKSDAVSGGDIAGGARKKLEKRIQKPIVSKENYLKKMESQKRIKERK